MKKSTLTKRILTLTFVSSISLSIMAISGDGIYFTQDFEDATQYPETSTDNEVAYTVEGQGEWLFRKAFQSTNSSYNENGSTKNLRMAKNGSYVVSPVLSNGVNKVTFYIGRASVTAYTSTDGGTTWTQADITTSGKTCTVSIRSDDVNRIKLANDASKDADIDNITIYAQTFETPIVLSTADATDITTSSAIVGGEITTNTGATVTEKGIVWSYVNQEPTLNDSVVTSITQSVSHISLTISGLKEGSKVYYRSYAKYDDTQTYGPVKWFKTAVSDNAQTVGADGTYFVQDFEDLSTYPAEKAATEQTFYVAGQGEWIYYNSFQATNASYIPDGSAHDLRMPKNSSYVVTPVLNYGVKTVTFDIGRKSVTAYTSKDGGTTWTAATIAEDGTKRTINVGDMDVNRIKIANDTGSDADIDNLTVTAQAYGTPATVTTGEAYNITKNTAELSGTILDRGDQEISESGFIWSMSNTMPTLADNVTESEDPTTNEISVLITGLKASQTVYYRAYALSNAGYAYGETKHFQTAEATLPVVVTTEVTKSGSRFKAGGIVTDDGGLALAEVGLIYGTQSPLNEENGTTVKLEPKAKFSATLSLAASTTYYIKAYATTAKGTAYGEELSVVTDEVTEKPDEIVGDEIWCSPNGNDAMADGSREHPFFDLQKAIDIAEAGDRIWMEAGTYVYDKRININDRNGTADAPIQVFAYGGRAVLDFSGMPYHAHSNNPYQGIRLTSSYWHFYKIDVTNASDNGVLIERNKPTGGSVSDIIARTQDGHDNIFEQCNFYRNGDTGLQMKNLGAYNYVINCDAYENADESDGDADGFAPKISVGDGNYFFGCRAWNNSDDGYDVFFKKDGGFDDNKTIIMEYCLAYENGIINGQATSGNGNGFKMGSNQGRMNCILNRCLAVRNLNKGFDQNHNSGDIIMNNCTGIGQTDIGGKSYSYRIYEELANGSVCEIVNSIAINDRLTTDKSESDMGKRGVWGRFEVTVASKESKNDWKCAPDNFVNMTNHEQLIGERQDDGSLPEIDYAHIDITRGTALIDAGDIVEANSEKYAAANITIPAIEYSGTAPDLGAYETDFLIADAATPKPRTNLTPTAIDNIDGNITDNKDVTIRKTRDGLVIIAVKNADAKTRYAVQAFDLSGRLLGEKTFNGATVVSLSNVKGTVILRVSGNGTDTVKKIAR